MKKGLIAIIGLSLIMGILMPRIAEASDFTFHDHTLVMEAIISHHSEIKELLPENPTTADVLNAALQVPDIDEYTKNRISTLLALLPQIEEWKNQIPDEVQEALDEIQGTLEGCENVSEMIQALQNMIDSHQYDEYEGLPDGLQVGIQILQDGQGTIYDPNWPPYGDFEVPMIGPAGAMGIADIIGGCIGGVKGYTDGDRGWDLVGDIGWGALEGSVGWFLGKFL